MTNRWTSIVVLVLSAAVLVSCSSQGSNGSQAPTITPTSTFVMPELEFGRGLMPPSIPSTFPTPEQAVVGATMMDGPRNLTEVIVTYPADVDAVVDFYVSSLPLAGFRVDSSAGTSGTWTIVFSGEQVSGEIRLDTVASDLTTGTLSFAHG